MVVTWREALKGKAGEAKFPHIQAVYGNATVVSGIVIRLLCTQQLLACSRMT